MRALGLLLVVVGMATAHARPVRSGELKNPFEKERVSACDASKVWVKVTSCLARQGYKISVLHEVDGARLVALRWDKATEATLGLFLLERGTWTRQGFYATTNASNELLSFKRAGDAYRMDVGSSVSTTVQLEDGFPKQGTLRRIFTTECRTGRGCRTITTSCDVLVDGKALWAFHGRMIWNGTGAVKVAGDTRFAGKLCAPPKTLLAPFDEAQGDPLE
ncbi:MAG: hypothetical protein HOV81_23675 [Kofleriaceae bacterium]|nr:hypothetical protein [Kofleriaceae bacterium]